MDKIQRLLAWSSTRPGQTATRFKRITTKAAFVTGIVCGIAFASMLFGLALDASPAANMGMGPDWKYALADPTWWGVSEKLFTCMAVGYMLGIIPGGFVALCTMTWLEIRKNWLAEAEQTKDFFGFGLFDQVIDKNGKILDKTLVALHDYLHHQKSNHLDKRHIQYLIRNRARIGMVEVLPDGTATYTIMAADLIDHPNKERERVRWIDFALIVTAVTAGLTAFRFGVLAMSGLMIVYASVLSYISLKRKVKFQRFLQREFARLDANNDGLVDELEIVKLWPKLAESERPMLTKLHEMLGIFGHEVLRDDGLTIRGVTRLEVDTSVPTLARLIA